MKISDLPEPYNNLFWKRFYEQKRKGLILRNRERLLEYGSIHAISWEHTPEIKANISFWSAISLAETEEDLPPIPNIKSENPNMSE